MDNAFTEEINKIALCSNGDKRMLSINSIETSAFRTKRDLVSTKEKIKCNNLLKKYKKMINFDDVTKKTKHKRT